VREVKRDKVVRDNLWNIVHVRVGIRMDCQVLVGGFEVGDYVFPETSTKTNREPN
jgi:hypothetical protein